MRLPTPAKEGYSVAAKIDEIINYLRGERIISVIGGRLQQSGNGKTIIIDKAKPGRGGSGEDIDHMWKVTSAGQSDDETPIPLVKVRGGALTVQGAPAPVADVASMPAGTDGFVCLKVTRNSASRAYVSHEIQWHESAPTSIAAYEYYILASIYDGKITQHRYEEIISYEMMHVANGEFTLGPFSMLTRNTYTPPAP
jgi:hypothetical protein